MLCRFDRCICMYDTDKLDKPKEAFKRVRDCGKAGFTSLAFDPHNNVLLAGSLDGVLRVWSVEGRCGRFNRIIWAQVSLLLIRSVLRSASASAAVRCAGAVHWVPSC